MAQGHIKLMQEFVLKILSGPMFGVDVALPSESVHLFFCDNETIEKSHTGSVYQHSLNTLIIPCAHGANEKILLCLTNNEDSVLSEHKTITATAQRIPLTPHHVDGLAEETTSINSIHSDTRDEILEGISQIDDNQNFDSLVISLNQPVTIGHAIIALKLASEEWSHEVAQYSYPLKQQTITGVQSPSRSSVDANYWFFFKCAAFGILCLACVAALLILSSPNNVGTLQDILAPVNPGISQNKNGEIYVLTKTPSDAEWSEIALRKNNVASSHIKIMSEPTEVARMETLLSGHIIPFFDIKFTSAFTIHLMLSQERSAKFQNINKLIQNILRMNFPYLITINVQKISDDVVLANATERLKALGVYHQKDITADHVTFNISGDVDDFRLSTLRQQVNEFYTQYGDQYVKFIINLNEDPLRNRTFKTGANSYVVIPGNHWLYSDITATHQY